MSAGTAVEWAHDTFNAWWGCTHVSEACRFCYAERMAPRQGVGWGPTAERRIASERHWAEPLSWNRAAQRKRRRRRVFCLSMGDVAEDRPELALPRERLFALIDETRALDWLLLTKRPENVADMLPKRWRFKTPQNVWWGVTAETQKDADRRLSVLETIPAVVRFASFEPLLEPVRIGKHARWLDWAIGGGESGRRAEIRPAHPAWFHMLRDELTAASIPFFFKQWGDWVAARQLPDRLRKRFLLSPRMWLAKNGDRHTQLDVDPPFQWEGERDARQWELMLRVGKKDLGVHGKVLDRTVHVAVPKQARLFRA